MTGPEKGTAIALLGCAAALLAAGCQPTRPLAHPPASVSEFDRAQAEAEAGYPEYTVLLYNLQRTLDPGLEEQPRLSSLELVALLGVGRSDVPQYLAPLLDDSETPAELRRRVGLMLDPLGGPANTVARGADPEALLPPSGRFPVLAKSPGGQD